MGRLQEGKSYRLETVMVNEYGCQKYLSLTENGVVEDIGDTGPVVREDEDDDKVSEGHGVAEGEIVAVLGTDEFKACISCRSKVKAVNTVVGV